MYNALFALILGIGLSVTVTPYVMFRCDRHLSKARLEKRDNTNTVPAPIVLSPPIENVRTSPTLLPTDVLLPASSQAITTWTHADVLDSLSRSARQNATASESLHALPSHVPSIITEVTRHVKSQHTAHAAIAAAATRARNDDDRSTLWLLQAALVHGFFIPSALDRGAVVLREIATSRDELTVASAQSRLSARILTFIPLVIAGFSALVSDGARRSMFGSINGFVALCLGVGLSWLGWRWIQRIVMRVHDDPSDHAALIAVIDAFAVSLRAGLTVTQAFDRVAELAPSSIRSQCESVSRALHHGVTLSEAVSPLRDILGTRSAVFFDMILSADRDGLPIVNLIDRLSEEARRQRQRDTDIRIRQIPARLTFPLVFCILPSFIVLTMFPIVSSSFSSLQLPFPDTAVTTISINQP
jgi:Flp pilus assembly protein TadB